jgi:histidinol-phosphate aminotransferase
MSRAIEELIPEYLRGLPVYIPGKPIEEVERELKIHAVKLASNENPLGPSPKGIAAARAVLAEAHRYPDGGTHYLREKLAALHGVSPEEIFVGLGSSEIIDLAARVLLRSGWQGLTSEGSYAPFSVAIRASGAELVLVRQRNFAFDLEAMAKAITPKTRVIYLANPNNPTGTAFSGKEFEEFLAKVPDGVLVVLDEAYIHYAVSVGLHDSMAAYRKRKNMLILRTFSKVYGLAGMRIGYAIGTTELLLAMNKLKTPFNTSGVAQAAGLAALEDHGHVERCIETNAAERARLCAGLTKMGLRPVESESNFLFVPVGPEAKEMSDELLRKGVIVRPLGWMGFPEAIRISVGTADENEKFLRAMTEVKNGGARKRAPTAPGKSGLAAR